MNANERLFTCVHFQNTSFRCLLLPLTPSNYLGPPEARTQESLEDYRSLDPYHLLFRFYISKSQLLHPTSDYIKGPFIEERRYLEYENESVCLIEKV